MDFVTLQRPGDARGSTQPALATKLREDLAGDVRFDALSRTIYATDASIYEIIPAGVVLPKTVNDVVRTVQACRDAGVPIIARGAGTGLTGGAIGEGIALDLSRYLNRIGAIDPAARTVRVEPGVVLDELIAALAVHGLQFAPDVATSSRATIGGMIANNSCGAHSVLYGRTVDHVVSMTVVLSDGEVVEFSRSGTRAPHGRSSELAGGLDRIRSAYADEISRRFPKVMRSNGGYGLDRLGTPGTPIDVTKVLCGSEGTLGIIVGATLGLVPLPRFRSVVVLHYEDLLPALGATPAILRHAPAAVELIDRLIMSAGRANAALAARCDFLKGDPEAILAVEFFDDNETSLRDRTRALLEDAVATCDAYAVVELVEPGEQKKIWDLRKAGLGLLMSRPGDDQPYSFVEDTAVDPARLSEYIARFRELLTREGVHAGYYAHASVGCIHVKPVLNLKTAAGVEAMRRIAEGASDLALEFGGAVSGEHGDGIVRSCWIEKTYGPRIVQAFREVKQLFDPAGLLNPHKIVDPWPMTERLRYGAAFRAVQPRTTLDFERDGGVAGLAGMCTGVGQCRQRMVGTMCPSFVATGDETHTTRARANALRMALSNRGLLRGLDNPHLAEVMDLCISCKACKSECPTGVDMARLKAEFLSHQNLRHGASRRSRLIADMPHRLQHAQRLPRLFNLFARSLPARWYLEQRYGLDRRMPLPPLATSTFRRWYRRHRRAHPRPEAPRGRVAYFVDTWTNHLTPQVGKAVVQVFERLGYHVLCPPAVCCGRPAISKGLLSDAKLLAEANVAALSHLVDEGIPIVGSEPSCILTFVDEYPQLVRSAAAKRLAGNAMMIETFLARLLAEDPMALSAGGRTPAAALLYHAHCHQKALVGTWDAASLMKAIFGESARELNTGCCGMAGSFGHEVEHYEVAKAIGEERLFPAVRNRGDAAIAVSGFSCRTQIGHHTGVQARHLVEHLELAMRGRSFP